MASRSSTVIISSSPIAKVGGLLTLTIAAINGTRLPFSFASVPLAPKYDSHPFGGWPPNLVSTMGDTGSLLWLSLRFGEDCLFASDDSASVAFRFPNLSRLCLLRGRTRNMGELKPVKAGDKAA